MSDWIKLHRKIQDSTMYRTLTSKQRDILIQCLILANFKENEWEWNGNSYKCQPGQFITSLDGLKKVCAKDVSIQNIRTCLLKLERWHFLTNESTNQNRLITITKWELYQNSTNELTDELTDDQQATNKQLTTNKNIRSKEVKKEYVYSIFYDYQLSIAKEFYTKNPSAESKKYCIDYFDLICWFFNKGKFLKNDLLGNPIDNKKYNILRLPKQLRYFDFITLRNKCMNYKIKLIEILEEMEAYAKLSNNKDVYRSALTFIKNKAK